MEPLPLGKLPPHLLGKILSHAPQSDPRIIIGPGIGFDCAVLDFGPRLLVIKSDPITFASREIGWYLVQVNANDLATTGADPRWLMVTALLPEGLTTPGLVEEISGQVYDACAELGISVIGGHTEITTGLVRPILCGTLLGEVEPDQLVSPKNAVPGDRLLLTKGVPIEATALLAREIPERLVNALTEDELKQAQDFLYDPGISVTRDARIARSVGGVHAMHDPTEGGLAGALWELSDASGRSLLFFPHAVPVPEISAAVCAALEIDPLASIASGALLMAVDPRQVEPIITALQSENIACREIGVVEEGPTGVWVLSNGKREAYIRPERDEIARIFE